MFIVKNIFKNVNEIQHEKSSFMMEIWDIQYEILTSKNISHTTKQYEFLNPHNEK